MGKEPTIQSTIELIKELHAGVCDDTGHPYWMHPVAVMEMLPDGAEDDERKAHLLHDTIEDAGILEDDLREWGYSERTIQLVVGVSRNRAPPGLTYMEWIRSIAASGDLGLIRLKYHDNRHNADPVRIASIPDPEVRREAENRASSRYRRSMKILQDALEGLEARPTPSS